MKLNSVNALYIHFPFCRHLCNYCDFFKHQLNDNAQIEQFEEILNAQWQANQALLTKYHFKMNTLDSIYLGGGTPSLWGIRGAAYLKELFEKESIKFSSGYEFTMEVDPDAWTKEGLESWIDIGVNRISVGAQSGDKNYLEILDRKHSLLEIEKTLLFLAEKKMNYSVDLLIGAPAVKPRNILKEIEWFLQYTPMHFSVYILKTRKNYVYQKRLPVDENIAAEYLSVCELLEASGYNQYEVSNFSRRGFESKHNQKYWDHSSVAAIGASATGFLNLGNEKSLRYQWKSSAADYQEEMILGSSLKIEKIFLGLRNREGLLLNELFPAAEHQRILDRLYQKWGASEYLHTESNREKIRLSAKGYLMCDSVLDDIFSSISF